MVSVPGNSEKKGKENRQNKQTKKKKLNVWGFLISQNMHIKNIITEQRFW